MYSWKFTQISIQWMLEEILEIQLLHYWIHCRTKTSSISYAIIVYFKSRHHTVIARHCMVSQSQSWLWIPHICILYMYKIIISTYSHFDWRFVINFWPTPSVFLLPILSMLPSHTLPSWVHSRSVWSRSEIPSILYNHVSNSLHLGLGRWGYRHTHPDASIGQRRSYSDVLRSIWETE